MKENLKTPINSPSSHEKSLWEKIKEWFAEKKIIIANFCKKAFFYLSVISLIFLFLFIVFSLYTKKT